MYMSDKLYNLLKWVAQYLLPGGATLYFAIAPIWGLPYTEQIVGTLVALNVFIGGLLGLSTVQYMKATQQNSAMMTATVPVPPTTEPMPWTLPEKTYDLLKWVAMIVLPSLGTLYLALATLWGFPYGQQIVSTVAALTTFLGIFLGVSSSNFKQVAG